MKCRKSHYIRELELKSYLLSVKTFGAFTGAKWDEISEQAMERHMVSISLKDNKRNKLDRNKQEGWMKTKKQ